jgi:hypothetical protein
MVKKTFTILLATCFHAGILFALFYPEDGGGMFLSNDGLHGVISQKIVTLHNHRCENFKSYIYLAGTYKK